jgi:hypothetical protein
MHAIIHCQHLCIIVHDHISKTQSLKIWRNFLGTRPENAIFALFNDIFSLEITTEAIATAIDR